MCVKEQESQFVGIRETETGWREISSSATSFPTEQSKLSRLV